FFNRQPDTGGYSSWLGVMANGGSRQYVLAGFVNSVEFKTLCDSYGINSGSLNSSDSCSYTVTSNTNSAVSSIENNLFNAVNNIRAQYGIGQLSLDPSLSNTARSRSADMINRNYFSHTTPEGKNIFTILNENGFGWQVAGENIFQCSPSANGSEGAILNMWMSSSSHRDNILNGAFNRVGIGIIDSGNSRTATIIFAN
ncbi:MAG: CAP domain-containing protein, partial [Actinobacteria bacterium]|nr:CAP domain-containing protein [Actinomycetota bacterium]